MPRYITLIRFTQKGAQALKQSPTRAAAFAKAAEKAGVKVEGQYWTLGAHDGALILSGDERKVLRCVADLASKGNVSTETIPAFDAKEFAAIVGA